MKTNPVFLLLISSTLWLGCRGESNPEKDLSQSFEFGETLTYEQQQGEYLFNKYCAICHGESGKGDGFNAYNLDPRPRDLSDPDYMKAFSHERLAEVIVQGGRGINKSVTMPAWGNTFRSYQIDYLVEYIKLFSQHQQTQSQQE